MKYCKKERGSNTWVETDATEYQALPADRKRTIRNGECSDLNSSSSTTTTTRPSSSTTTTTIRSVTPSPGTYYQECYGPKYQKGCKDPGATKKRPNTEGSIYQVQGCIGATQDSYFGPKTLTALQTKTGKKSFIENDIEKICEGSSIDNNQTMDTPQEQISYWKKLIKDKRIYPYGLIAQLKSNQVVYIIGYDVLKGKNGDVVSEKRIKLNPDAPVKGQITKEMIKNPEKEFIVHFVIQPNENEGKWSRFVIRDKYGDEVVDLEPTDPSRTWEPDDALYGVDDIFESYVKRAINKKINEQKYKGRGITTPGGTTPGGTTPGGTTPGGTTPGGTTPGGTTPGGTTPGGTTPGGTTPQNTSSQSGPTKDDIDKLTSLKTEGLSIIDQWDLYNENITQKIAEKDGSEQPLVRSTFKGKVNELIDENRVKIQKIKPEDFCTQDIDGNLAEIENQKKDKGFIMTNVDKDYLDKISNILKQVKSKCNEIKNRPQTNQTTTNTTQNQGSTSTTSSTSQNLSKDDLLKLFGFVKEDGTTYDPKSKIEKLGKQNLGESGSGTIQNAIDNSGAKSEHFLKYNEMITLIGLGDEYKLRIPMTSEKDPGAIIKKENESVLIPPMDQESLTQYEKLTFGKYLGTTSTLSIYVGKKSIASGQGPTQACPYDTRGIRDYLINYLIRAFNASALDMPNRGEKETLCKCSKDGTLSKQDFDPIKKDDWNNTATKTKINIKNVPRNMFNLQLRWNDIQNLMRGEEVSGVQLKTVWTDRDFGSSNCIDSLTESLRKNIKSNISEAINKKNIITESVKSQILNRLSRRQ